MVRPEKLREQRQCTVYAKSPGNIGVIIVVIEGRKHFIVSSGAWLAGSRQSIEEEVGVEQDLAVGLWADTSAAGGP